MLPEARLRARCRMYLANGLPPPGFWSSVEMGRLHAGTPEQRMHEWTRLAAQGVKVGLPDIMIWYMGRFIGVELKAGRNKSSDPQRTFAAAMRNNGFVVHEIRSIVGLHEALEFEGVPVLPSMRIAALHHDAALSVPVKKRAA